MTIEIAQAKDITAKLRPTCIAALRAGVFGLAALSLAVAATVWDAEAASGQSSIQNPVRLVQSVQVTGNNIRLGDIFENAGDYADRVIARSPAPGQSATLEARWLARVAKAFRLQWRPGTRYDNTVVTRLSHILSNEAIQNQIKGTVLSNRIDLAPDEVDVQLDNRFLSLTLPTDRPATLAVQNFRLDPRTERFSATLAAPATPPYAVQIPISGQVHRMIEVPVPAARIMRGEIISGSDLTTVRVRSNSMPGNAITDIGLLAGQSAKNTLAAGKPIAANAVQPPVLVAKGSIVTVKLATSFMLLTARGRAMEAGGLDDVIRVQNRQSNRTFDAIVTGPGQAEVSLPSQVALQ